MTDDERTLLSCFRCEGTGKVGRDDRRHAPLTCPRCDGTGAKVEQSAPR